MPLQVLYTNQANLWWHAFYLRDLEWCGLDPRGRLAAIRLLTKSRDELPRVLAGVSTPYWNKILHQLVETGPAYGLDVRQDPRRQLDWLAEVDPDYLVSYPSNLEFLGIVVRG